MAKHRYAFPKKPWDYGYRSGSNEMPLDGFALDENKLVEDIKRIEQEHKDGVWVYDELAHDVDVLVGVLNSARPNAHEMWTPPSNGRYESYITALYALRAFCRGKLHITRPPQNMANFNRSVMAAKESNRAVEFDAAAYNYKIASRIAKRYAKD